MNNISNTNKSFKNGLRAQAEAWDNHKNVLFHWMPAILSAIGLIVSWELNSLAGWAFSVGGAMYGWFSNNALNKITSVVIAAVVTILVVISVLGI